MLNPTYVVMLSKLTSFIYKIQGMKVEHKISASPSQLRQLLYSLFLVARGWYEETSAETCSL